MRKIRDYAFIVRIKSFRFLETNRKLIKPSGKWMEKASKATD